MICILLYSLIYYHTLFFAKPHFIGDSAREFRNHPIYMYFKYPIIHPNERKWRVDHKSDIINCHCKYPQLLEIRVQV